MAELTNDMMEAAYQSSIADLNARLIAAREAYWKYQEDYSGASLVEPRAAIVERYESKLREDFKKEFNSTNPRPIGNISNYYGALCVYEARGEYYWVITDDSGHYPARQQIPKSLYDELIRFDDRK